MSLVIAAPDVMAAAATDLANIGSTIRAADAAAASPTTGILAAAEDEVSAAIAALFSSHGKAFQALSAQAALFHEQFVQTLLHSASAIVGTEAANKPWLHTLEQDLLGVINAPSYALTGRPLIAPGAPGTGVPMSQNLLVNPGFEVADPSVSGYSGVTIVFVLSPAAGVDARVQKRIEVDSPLPGKDSFGPPAAASGLRSKDGAPSRRNSRLLGVQQNAADTARSRIRYRKGTPRAVRRVRRILYRPQPDMGGSRETHWTDSHVLQGCDRP